MKKKKGIARQNMAMLEVSFQKEKRKKKLFDHARALAKEQYTDHKIQSNVPESQLTTDNFVNIVAFGNINEVSEAQANFFGFEAHVATDITPKLDVAMDTTPTNEDNLTDISEDTTTLENMLVADDTTNTKAKSGRNNFGQDSLQTMRFDLKAAKDHYSNEDHEVE